VEIKNEDQRALSNCKKTGKMSQGIVCWIGDAPNHWALASRFSGAFGVAGIVVDKKRSANSRRGWMKLLNRAIDKFRFGKIDKAWSNMQDYYRQRKDIPSSVPILEVDNINDPAVKEFTEKLGADLVVVSGTSLIKEPLVSLPLKRGIMNLHTGLSPYVKGGPNCTNWCIANNQWHLIGNTIMWISAGIDSGNIISSEQTKIDEEDDLDTIHLKVMRHAHDLYLRSASYIIDHQPPYPSVPQNEMGKGSLFLTKMWTAEKKKQLLKNLKGSRNSQSLVRTIPLPE
jgi:folate-dependent phosphoribosylglycinamide formyltransferase PurN